MLKITLNRKFITLKEIKILNRMAPVGEVIQVVDAFIEKGNPFIAIQLKGGVRELGFKTPRKLKSKTELRAFLDLMLMPYIEGAEHVIIKAQ